MKSIYNREISWLQFNDRVLQEARDRSVPLMQRLRFLGIFSNNLDEFVKVRVANLIRFSRHRHKNPIKMSGGLTPAELLPMLYEKMHDSQRVFRETYNNILSEMEQQGVYVINDKQLSDEQREFCREYFYSKVNGSLVPIILRKSVEIPFLPDGKIYLAVKMQGAKINKYAVIQVPVDSSSPRFVVLPSAEGRTDVIFLDDIIRLFLDDIFFVFSYESISAYTFKIVRDGEMPLDDDISKSLAEKVSSSISKREKGKPVRIIHDHEMPLDMLETIAKKLGLKSMSQYEGGGRYHLMRDLMKFPNVLPHLENKNPKPMYHPLIDPSESIIKVIKKQDVLLSYPYHTFDHFVDLLREAAMDPRVVSISVSLYRTAHRSKVVNALLNAVKNGKYVTAMVELKARFDEEQNILISDQLQSGGVRILTSQDTLKVHSKILLIERREQTGIKGYAYIGTGNFNESTSKIYSDFGLLTSNQTIAGEVRRVFEFLENHHKHPECKTLLVSPYNMRSGIEELINNEIKSAKKGKEAYFYGKFNSLTDIKMIELLYKASCAGVKIRLIIRGACCLQTGIKDLSENIEIRSIVDKYLEHARMIICCNSGKRKVYISSADLMRRNLDRRVEVAVGITDKAIERTLVDYFKIQWRDNVKARLTQAPYDNRYIQTEQTEQHRCQDELYEYFKELKSNES